MTSRWPVGILLALVLTAGAAGVAAAQVREQRPNLVGGELLGRGIALTLNYERFLTNEFGVGAGIMAFGTNDDFVGIIPVYASAALGDVHALYLSLGTTVFVGTGSVDDDFDDSEAVGSFAIGYQFQSEGGFFVRPLFTTLFDSGTYFVWPGITIGGSF